ncbi:hypothetical protein ACFWYW_14515 [Nonomuraea sp. NPDC059023]|uniref:hypothetical protein n=1 Tax=unclassified Nonomuraea TaxID=2593643 RepID=UPI0036C6602F
MPASKLDSKLLKRLEEVLQPYTATLFTRLGTSVVGIVEITSVERTEPYDEEERAPTVKLRLTGLEIATPEQEDALRRGQRAMYQLRTARDTLDALPDSEHALRQLNLLDQRLTRSEV